MGTKTVLLDDLTGDVLPDGTDPISLSFGRTRYSLYLSEDSYGKLLEALEPFIDGADQAFNAPTSQAKARAKSDQDRERSKAAREWARETGHKYAGADGKERTIGIKGAVPAVVITAWEEAGEPGLTV